MEWLKKLPKHINFYQFDKGVIINADFFEIAEFLPRINAIITDPPYGYLEYRIETNIDIQLFMQLAYNLLLDDSFLLFFGLQPMLSYWVIEALKLFKYKKEIIWYKRNPSSPVHEILRTFENIMLFMKGSRRVNDVRLPFTDIWLSLAEFIDMATIENYENKIKGILKSRDKINEIIKFELGDKAIYQKDHIVLGDYVTLSKDVKNAKRFVDDWRTISRGYKARDLISFIPRNKAAAGGYEHPTVKPESLMQYLIALTTNENDLILDMFAGSGTTGVAAYNLDRRFILIEIDKEYYQLAVKRLKKETQQKRLF